MIWLVSAVRHRRYTQDAGLAQSRPCHSALRAAHAALGLGSPEAVDAEVALQAMAMHGVLPEDRDELAQAVTVFLDGEPTPVTVAWCDDVRRALLMSASTIGSQSWALVLRAVSLLPSPDCNAAQFTAAYINACALRGTIVGRHVTGQRQPVQLSADDF